eukprot:354887-Chlamydomonas_euryale.AAC.10
MEVLDRKLGYISSALGRLSAAWPAGRPWLLSQARISKWIASAHRTGVGEQTGGQAVPRNAV